MADLWLSLYQPLAYNLLEVRRHRSELEYVDRTPNERAYGYGIHA